MAAGDSTVKLPKGVSVTVGGRTFRGECPERLVAPEHKLRKTVEMKKTSSGGKGSSKGTDGA